MAEIYKQYAKNAKQLDVETRVDSAEFGKTLIGVAMDQVELLQGVARRVQVFVDAWQKWEALGSEYDIVRGLPHEADVAMPVLTYDDLKILLEKFPQKDY